MLTQTMRLSVASDHKFVKARAIWAFLGGGPGRVLHHTGAFQHSFSNQYLGRQYTRTLVRLSLSPSMLSVAINDR